MFLRSNLLSIIWAIIIFFLSVIPGEKIPSSRILDFFQVDKLAHIVIYVILVFLILRGFQKQYTFPALRYHSKLYALIFAIVYGILLELHQRSMLNRNFDILDILANIIGCFIGTIVYTRVYNKV